MNSSSNNSHNPFTSPDNDIDNFPQFPNDSYFEHVPKHDNDDDFGEEADEEEDEHHNVASHLVDDDVDHLHLGDQNDDGYGDSPFGHVRSLQGNNDISNISLNLSIDTLAKVKPVDISNIESFLEQKHREEMDELRMRNEIEREDQQYFDQRAEELSPQSKAKKRIVLYDAENEPMTPERVVVTPMSATRRLRHGLYSPVGVQTDLSISPAMSVECTLYGDSRVHIEETRYSDTPPKTKSLLQSPDFMSPINSRTPVRGIQSPKFLMSPNTVGRTRTPMTGQGGPDFLSPIRPEHTPMRNQLQSPQFMSPFLIHSSKKATPEAAPVMSPVTEQREPSIHEQTSGIHHSMHETSKFDSNLSNKRASVVKRLPFEQAIDVNNYDSIIGELHRHSSGSSLYLDIPNTSQNSVDSPRSTSRQRDTHKSVSFSPSTKDNTRHIDDSRLHYTTIQTPEQQPDNRVPCDKNLHHSHHVVCSVCSTPIALNPYNFDLKCTQDSSDKRISGRSISPPTRRSYPFTVSPHRFISSHMNKSLYTRPLSPVNYEFFKARYKTQLKYIDGQERANRPFT